MVSGTQRRVKVIEMNPIAAKIIKVICKPRLASNDGKTKPITKLVIHKKITQQPMPKPRNLSGIISEMLSHRIGSRKVCMEKRKLTVKHRTRYGKNASPSKSEAVTAISRSEAVVPQKPTVNIFLRGMVFIKWIPIKVPTTEAKPFKVFAIIAACRLKPASVKTCDP